MIIRAIPTSAGPDAAIAASGTFGGTERPARRDVLARLPHIRAKIVK